MSHLVWKYLWNSCINLVFIRIFYIDTSFEELCYAGTFVVVIFGLYADDSLRIHKEDIDAIILKTDGLIPESLSELFEHVSI